MLAIDYELAIRKDSSKESVYVKGVLVKKEVEFLWSEKCQSSFKSLKNKLVNTPFTYTNFSYELLRIAQIHGSLRFGHFYEDLRVATSYLRFITMYLRKNSTIRFELSRITTSNLRAFYEFFTDCYEYITECYYSSKLLRVSYDLLPCCYEKL